MNVYDFDGTIYDGDSTVDFYMFCLKRHRKIALSAPKTAVYLLLNKVNAVSRTRFKEVFYEFLRLVDDADKLAELFWQNNDRKIKSWYLAQKQSTDLIISASPEFLLMPICKQLGVRLIASRVNKSTGKTEGENCRGEEKVRRYRTEFADPIDEFYSDTQSDRPMAAIATRSYLVNGNKIDNWIII
jgi:HAD superfamily phosphoserine phosphatase-like hydrolase